MAAKSLEMGKVVRLTFQQPCWCGQARPRRKKNKVKGDRRRRSGTSSLGSACELQELISA
jgi:hypothetical protein